MRSGELYIKISGVWIDLYTTYGVVMGDGFVDEILKPLTYKDLIRNESRNDHGVEYCVPVERYIDEHELSLVFKMIGTDREDLLSKKNAFFNAISTGWVYLYVSHLNITFLLLYKGKSSTIKLNRWLNVADIKICLIEPNPKNRHEGKV